MKITVNIDCTPEEARTFLGLPDLKPMQDAAMAAFSEKMGTDFSAMDPDALMKLWTPGAAGGLEAIQKAFWNQMTATQGGKTDDNGK